MGPRLASSCKRAARALYRCAPSSRRWRLPAPPCIFGERVTTQTDAFDWPGRGHQERALDVERIESTGQKGVTMAVKSKRRKIKVAPYDSADCLKTEAAIKNYLEAVLEVPVDRQIAVDTMHLVALS